MDTARRARRIHRSIAVLVVAITAGCATDEPASRIAAWCEAEPNAAVALTQADDEGSWANEGLGSPSFVELWRAGGLWVVAYELHWAAE